MYYQNEISTAEGYGKKYDVKLRPEEIKLADQLVKSLSAPFKPEAYRDEFQERLNPLIRSLSRPRGSDPKPVIWAPAGLMPVGSSRLDGAVRELG